jgi:mRNA interferase YafQ
MKIVTRTSQFKKDYKLMLKRGKKMEKLDLVIRQLFRNEKLDTKYKDHILIGPFKSRRECHIDLDWLLIYRIENDERVLERTGSHSDLFE